MNQSKRKQNEKEFTHWKDLKNGRMYWFIIEGRHGGKAVYLKEVNENESQFLLFRRFIMLKEI